MARKLDFDTQSPKTKELEPILLTLGNGIQRTMPRKKYGTETVESKTGLRRTLDLCGVDFTGEPICRRCNGDHWPDGAVKSGAGMLRVYRIDQAGVWFSFATACPACAYGALLASERTYDGHRVEPLPFADSLRDVPPGLTATELTMLGIYRKPGDGYAEAAARLGPGSAIKAKVDAWASSPHPTWSNEGQEKRCPEDERPAAAYRHDEGLSKPDWGPGGHTDGHRARLSAPNGEGVQSDTKDTQAPEEAPLPF